MILSPNSKLVTIPNYLAGIIIGERGQHATSIWKISGAKVAVHEDKEDSRRRFVTLTGTNNQIQYAQFLMQQRIMKYHHIGGIFRS